jgi:peptidoglycan hydrolase-like protein with peptidoglycan-binding domain
VHFDDRWVSSGYPITKRGSKGIYVCVAQDALTTLGYNTGGLDGIFGANTEKSVREYQTKKSITSDGILGPVSWRNLMADVVGKGSTSTTVN